MCADVYGPPCMALFYGILATNVNLVTVCAITEPWPAGLSALSKLYPLAKINILIKKKSSTKVYLTAYMCGLFTASTLPNELLLHIP